MYEVAIIHFKGKLSPHGLSPVRGDESAVCSNIIKLELLINQ